MKGSSSDSKHIWLTSDGLSMNAWSPPEPSPAVPHTPGAESRWPSAYRARTVEYAPRPGRARMPVLCRRGSVVGVGSGSASGTPQAACHPSLAPSAASRMCPRATRSRRDTLPLALCLTLLASLVLTACATDVPAPAGRFTPTAAPPTPRSGLEGGTWSSGATMEVPRSETAAAVINGLIYVPGGFNDEGDNENVLEAY